MRFNKVRLYLSAPRINRYLHAAANSKVRAVKLYKANLKITQAFHPILGVFEVILRNRINEILANHFADANWILNQKTGFMAHPSLTHNVKKTGTRKVNDFLLREVKRAENRLRRSGTPITNGKVIAEQTLGFWTDLFEVHHYKILIGKPIQIFTSLPTGIGRKEVNQELNKIRRFRNRINHNEPLCFHGPDINFDETLEVYNSITQVLRWIDPELLRFIQDLDKVDKAIAHARRI